MKLMPRKDGPAVWVYRWRETDEHGERCLRKQVIGSAKQYPNKALASAAIETLKLTVNRQGFQRLAGPKTLSRLIEHYRLKELPQDNHEHKTKKTKKVYESNLKNHIIPRWGSYRLRDILSIEVEEWLEGLDLAPGSRAKVRNQMSAIFRHGIRWGWLGQQENPIAMVRVTAKRLRTPETLTAVEFMALFGKLPDRERTMGTICASTGVRISEALGLKWKDVDFTKGLANVRRSVVDGSIGRCKTEVSQQPVPLDELTVSELQHWRMITMYASDEDWVFASERVFGKMPVWANSSLQKVLQPAAKRANITKTIGWHTFRHTYSSLLSEYGNDVKVVQELMRHAKVSTTMEVYTHARMEKKREAQSKVVDVLFGRARAVAVAS
ncbi:MAG: site-specific integrase [Acidobacteria bacterium]|nr:site-specific integrase [Acidobacteriota bacterium]